MAPSKKRQVKRSRGGSGSSTSSRNAGPPELEAFARFCALLTLEDGSPFVLEPFQRTMLGDLFGGARETVVLLPKKNGKTTVLAALSLYHLCTTPDADCVIAAASRNQASIMLRQARGFIRRSEELKARIVVKQRELEHKTLGGKVQVLASDVDTMDGWGGTLAFVDELHRHKRDEPYGLLRDGLGPRQGQMVAISTAGSDEASPLGRLRKAALAFPGLSREGPYVRAASPNGRFAFHEWSLEAGADLEDLGLVKTANPASWQTLDELRERHDSASMNPWQWARFACNVWASGDETAISPLDWAKCGSPGCEIPEGEEIYLGVDLAFKWDTTAIVPLWMADKNVRRLGRPAIVVPPRDGTSTRETEMIAPILEFHRRFRIRAVVFDRNFGGEQLAQKLEFEHGINVVEHSQDPSPMSLAAERFAAAVREELIEHPEDDELTHHVLSAVPKQVGEKWRFVKNGSGGSPIDALIAAAMAHSVALGESEKVVDPSAYRIELV